MKVIFVGHPGSGKTYAATSLAERKNIQAIDIDSLLDNVWYFFFKAPYRKAFDALLQDKSQWIIDGYGGSRMPANLWDKADYIIYIDLPKAELKRNIITRYRYKKANREATHGQHLFVNVLKNLGQVYVLDFRMRHCIQAIRHSANVDKLREVHSRQELHQVLDKLAGT